MTQQIVNNIAAGFVIIPTTSTKKFPKFIDNVYLHFMLQQIL